MTLRQKKLWVVLAVALGLLVFLWVFQLALGKARTENEYRVEAQSLLDAKRTGELLALVEEWRRIYPGSQMALLAQADALVSNNQLDVAARLYDQVLTKNPQQPEVWGRFGSTLFNMGNYAGAMAACGRGLQQNPNQEQVWLCYGMAASLMGQVAELVKVQKVLEQGAPATLVQLRQLVRQHACAAQATKLGNAWCGPAGEGKQK